MAKIWITADGDNIPAKFVPAMDKKKDRYALKMAKKAKDLNNRITEFKQEMMEDGDSIWEEMQAAENVRTGKLGYSITSFDKSVKIEVNQSTRIEFDGQIEIAKTLITEYLDDKLNEADADIKQLVHHAFESNKGQLDTKKVIGLFKWNIKHDKWVRAIELIKKSMTTNLSKRYATIMVKDANGEYKDIKLNFSAI